MRIQAYPQENIDTSNLVRKDFFETDTTLVRDSVLAVTTNPNNPLYKKDAGNWADGTRFIVRADFNHNGDNFPAGSLIQYDSATDSFTSHGIPEASSIIFEEQTQKILGKGEGGYLELSEFPRVDYFITTPVDISSVTLTDLETIADRNAGESGAFGTNERNFFFDGQTDLIENGLYVLSTTGAVRHSRMDVETTLQHGAKFFVVSGANSNGWYSLYRPDNVGANLRVDVFQLKARRSKAEVDAAPLIAYYETLALANAAHPAPQLGIDPYFIGIRNDADSRNNGLFRIEDIAAPGQAPAGVYWYRKAENVVSADTSQVDAPYISPDFDLTDWAHWQVQPRQGRRKTLWHKLRPLLLQAGQVSEALPAGRGSPLPGTHKIRPQQGQKNSLV